MSTLHHSFTLLGLVATLFAPLAHAERWPPPNDQGRDLNYITRPLPPDYRLNKDGSATLRICYNWTCAAMKSLTFTRDDLETVTAAMQGCPDTGFHDRVQRMRIGIWQMELLAQKYLPILANDREINEFDREVAGRLDCVDNSTNTTTYLHLLRDLRQLSGWTIAEAEVRDLTDFRNVHWTAVVIDDKTQKPWSVDSWFRPNGHLPFVMPLGAWVASKKAWEPPFDKLNPYPDSVPELCETPRQAAAAPAASTPPM
jgi:hypothetical protein